MFSDLRIQRKFDQADKGGEFGSSHVVPAREFIRSIDCDKLVKEFRDMMATFVRDDVFLNDVQQEGIRRFLESTLTELKRSGGGITQPHLFGQAKLLASQATSNFITMLNSLSDSNTRA